VWTVRGFFSFSSFSNQPVQFKSCKEFRKQWRRCSGGEMSCLRAELLTTNSLDNTQAHQLTILLNEYDGGQWWKDTIPNYADVKKFRKHFLSMCCVTLKGLKKFSYQHASHLIPQFDTKSWIRGLLCNLWKTELMIGKITNSHESKQTLLQKINGCSKIDVWAQNGIENGLELIKIGRPLAKRLRDLNWLQLISKAAPLKSVWCVSIKHGVQQVHN